MGPRQTYKDILRKLERIQALYHRPGTDGEKQAAARAIARLQEKLGALRKYEKMEVREVEFEVFNEA